MRIVCLGGGPAGLYFSILMKKADPSCHVKVVERNRPDDTFGWGVVFSDKTMDGFREADPQVVEEIERAFRHWDDIDVHYKGTLTRSSGHGFCGISRMKLLQILQARATELGVELAFEENVDDPDTYAKEYDLVVGSDGVHSVTRQKHEAHYNPRIDVRKCRFIWLGTKKKLDAFTFAFEETEHGWFNLHAYRFDDDWSTFIVETPEETWKKAGLDAMEASESVAYCEKLFGKLLDGERLVSNAKHLRGSAVWLKFNRVLCERWFKDNVVLIGDAAHTAHFAIGSGTKLAMEDAIALSRVLTRESGTIPERLARYQAEREVEALKLQSAARNRMTWFEDIERYTGLEPEQFVFSLLTGSQRIGHENLKVRDPAYVQGVDRYFAKKAGLSGDKPVPPMFTPYTLRNVTLENRVVMSPMCMYSAKDGVPDDFHLVHYGSRALGGVGLIVTEMTGVAPEGRITPGCTGLWNDEQVAAWKRIVAFVHGQGKTKIAIQLGHAGPKGSTKVPWEGVDVPLTEGGWEIMAPSAVPYWKGVSHAPRAMTRADMDAVKAQFVAATKRAIVCGFDVLELHCAHGYLLSAFISPLTNVREDEYGGSLENRCRFPLEVFRAMREAWGDRPMSVRLSAHDWVPGGIDPGAAADVARLFKEASADIVHVSSGQVSKEEQPVYGRMFQVPFSDKIRNEINVPTIAVGNITELDHVNTIVAAGRADLCALARPHLADPFFTVHAAAEQGHGVPWPKPYEAGRLQLERSIKKAQTPIGEA
ncbi:MAG: bifunctional salicylyl-CoA 5-hydroxylase/oxidoreductase [Myxococcales bacterium]|nr:bifunctional salicylyl-CoA 5-hydroxylase/oxidoreductase [Myxococcales bacterium]